MYRERAVTSSVWVETWKIHRNRHLCAVHLDQGSSERRTSIKVPFSCNFIVPMLPPCISWAFHT